MAPLQAHILGAPVIFGDDTTLPLQVAGRATTATARLWSYVSAGDIQDANSRWQPYARAAFYEFTTTRAAEHPQRFLAKYSGYLQADDYAGYHELFRTRPIVHVACWAHARRKFFDIDKTQKTPGLAREALAFIGQLYAVERDIREHPPDMKQRVRQERSVALLADFQHWLAHHHGRLLPQGPLAKAMHYALSNWAALTRFTECGMLAIDSNLVERGMRPIAVGRHNWLFAGSERGGRAAAVAFSLIESARLAGIEPYAYLKDVLARINRHRTDRLAELLPFNWTPLAA